MQHLQESSGFETDPVSDLVEDTEGAGQDMETIMYGRNVNHAEVVLV